MSPRHHKCWEALSPPSVKEPPSVGDGGYLAINGVWMGWAVYKNSLGYMANCIFFWGVTRKRSSSSGIRQSFISN